MFLYRLLSKCPGVLSERFLRVGMARAVEAVRFLRKFEITVGTGVSTPTVLAGRIIILYNVVFSQRTKSPKSFVCINIKGQTKVVG